MFCNRKITSQSEEWNSHQNWDEISKTWADWNGWYSLKMQANGSCTRVTEFIFSHQPPNDWMLVLAECHPVASLVDAFCILRDFYPARRCHLLAGILGNVSSGILMDSRVMFASFYRSSFSHPIWQGEKGERGNPGHVSRRSRNGNNFPTTFAEGPPGPPGSPGVVGAKVRSNLLDCHIIRMAGYPASLEFPIIHTLWIH